MHTKMYATITADLCVGLTVRQFNPVWAIVVTTHSLARLQFQRGQQK